MKQRIFSGRPLPLLAAVVGIAALAMGQSAQAQFATFTVSGNPPLPETFVFNNNESGTTATFTGSAPIEFRFQGFEGDPNIPSGTIAAKITLTAATSAPASTTTVFGGITILGQPFNEPLDTIEIRDLQGNNLLTVKFTGVELGLRNGNEASLQGSFPGTTVNYTSDFITFSGTTARSFEVAFAGLGGLTLAGNGLLNDSDGAVTGGSFSASGGITSVPEPAALGMMSAGLVCLPGYLAVRRRQTLAKA